LAAVAFSAANPQTIYVNDPSSLAMHAPEPAKAESGSRLPRTIFVAIVLAAVAQCVFSFAQLPATVASHFGPSGAPNGWMSKQAFFAIYAAVIAIAAAVEIFPARSIAKSSSARINLPHKQYWLAPERRGETMAYFEKFFAWYGCAFLLILVLIMGLAIQANLNPPPHLPTGPTLAIIIGFVAFNIAAVIQIFRRFSKIN
jgi:uncharacterized membrane protein